ncbi:MAG: SUMF1/EgtB/PvdO family nonheme iron enzyme [Polyangiaceae bacterium]
MRLSWALLGALVLACAAHAPEAIDPPPPPAPSRTEAVRHADAGAKAAIPDAGARDSSGELGSKCPPDMLHIERNFCPKVERRCLKSEYDKANHITICHRFAPGVTECQAPRIPLAFCIDRYEYPNEKGAHPPVMVSFYDASGLCAAKGKRLCYESEWTAACEGPNETPFPYGWERSAEKCNFDNAWVNPSLSKIYSSDPGVRDAELARLDRSVPSGSKPECVSADGVHDLTGNVDEWVLADHDRPEEKGRFSALKGGAWGHVRNACRPVTTSHAPEFTYYFVSFRCCSDPGGEPRDDGG